MLEENRTYTEIIEETGASTATISLVKRCLVYGAEGYRRVADRLLAADGRDFGGE